MVQRRAALSLAAGLCALSPLGVHAAQSDEPPPGRPNILVIWGDDVGYWNVSFNNHGMMGYGTPHIDRLGNEGLSFTDLYGEPTCTAGRAAFLTGQSPVRTGLTQMGLPGSELGLDERDPTLAELLAPHGYTSGHFGASHVGQRDEHLPTRHGFDEFLGYLHHLDAEEAPEDEDYPRDPSFRKRFGPRGVVRSTAGGDVEDTGPLTRERMETVDGEFLAGAVDFIRRAHGAERPFFVWFAPTRMHAWTRLAPESRRVTRMGLYPDGMVEHDGHVGVLLDLLDELEIAGRTIVIYSSDNGASVSTWPDGGTVPWRGEQGTGWEGGYRVPGFVRWPGRIPAGARCNGIVSHLDWVPTLMSAVGERDVKSKLREGHAAGAMTWRVQLEGFDMLDYFEAGGAGYSPRKFFLYFDAEGALTALRYQDWKLVLTDDAVPAVLHLRSDPFERAPAESISYERWARDKQFILGPAQQVVTKFLKTFEQFPSRRAPAGFRPDELRERVDRFRRVQSR